MTIPKILCALMLPVFVIACAPKPAPVVQGQPIYNKLGGQVGCESGVYIPGARPQDQCAPPEDCDPQLTSTSNNPKCPPPGGCDPQLTASTFDPNCVPGRGDNDQPQRNTTGRPNIP